MDDPDIQVAVRGVNREELDGDIGESLRSVTDPEVLSASIRRGQYLEKAREDAKGNLLTENLKAVGVAGGSMVLSPLVSAFGPQSYADEINRVNDAVQQAIAERDKESPLPEAVMRAGRGIASQLPAMIVAAQTMGVQGPVGMFTANAASTGYTRAKDAGLSDQDAIEFAAKEAAIEGVVTTAFTKMGRGGIESLAAGIGKETGKRSAKQIASQAIKTVKDELGEELTIEALHALNEAADGVDPEALKPESLMRRAIDTALQTVGQTTMTQAYSEGVNALQQRGQVTEEDQAAAEAKAEMDRVQQERERLAREQEAQQAAQQTSQQEVPKDDTVSSPAGSDTVSPEAPPIQQPAQQQPEQPPAQPPEQQAQPDVQYPVSDEQLAEAIAQSERDRMEQQGRDNTGDQPGVPSETTAIPTAGETSDVPSVQPAEPREEVILNEQDVQQGNVQGNQEGLQQQGNEGGQGQVGTQPTEPASPPVTPESSAEGGRPSPPSVPAQDTEQQEQPRIDWRDPEGIINGFKASASRNFAKEIAFGDKISYTDDEGNPGVGTIRGVNTSTGRVEIDDVDKGRYVQTWASHVKYDQQNETQTESRPVGETQKDDTVSSPEPATVEQPKREYSSTQFNMPPGIAAEVQKEAAKIADADLSQDGRETEPHITVKYGLEIDDPTALRDLLKDQPPVRVKVGKTSIFPANEKQSQRGGDQFDVVKIDIEGDELRSLNAKIAAAVPNQDTFPEYKPHMTLGYVKPGEGQKYAGNNALEGQEFLLEELTFSGRNGEKVTIPLTGKRKLGQQEPASGNVATPESTQTPTEFELNRDNAIAKVLKTWGQTVTAREPQTAEEQDQIDFLRSRGKQASFVDGDESFSGALDEGSGFMLIAGNRDTNDIWRTIGHELAHETKLDRVIPIGSEELATGREKRLARAKGPYKQRLESEPELLDREARADIVGEFMRDKAFRDRIARENPTMWERLREAVLKVVGKWTPRNEAEALVLKELRKQSAPKDDTVSSPAKTDTVSPESTKPAPRQEELSEKQAADNGDPAVPEFKRTTPTADSTERKDRAERITRSQRTIGIFEQQRQAKQKELDGLRSNATRKREKVRGEINSLNRSINDEEDKIRYDRGRDVIEKLEDALESPRSYDHYIAGMMALHRAMATDAENAAKTGSVLRNKAQQTIKEQEALANELDADLQAKAKEIAKSQGMENAEADQVALTAARTFTVFEDRSLADLVSVAADRARYARVAESIGKLNPPSRYARQPDLTPEQQETFKRKYQEASKDDKNWEKKRGEIDQAVEDTIASNRRVREAKESEERANKEAEKAESERQALERARERAKKYNTAKRIDKALKSRKMNPKQVFVRQKESGGVEIVEGMRKTDDKKGDLYPNGLIVHPSFGEDAGSDHVIVHAKSGLAFPFTSKKADAKALVAMTDLLGIDFNVDVDAGGMLPSDLQSRMKKVNNAWSNDDFSLLSDEDQATVESLAEVAETNVNADLILTADDLGANGIPPGMDKVMNDRGVQVVKDLAKSVPEFAYDPVFTFQNGNLVFRDGYAFRLNPKVFNLSPSELKEGQTVGINLEDMKIKRNSPQEVVAEMMKNAGLPNVKKTRGGDVTVGSGFPVSVQNGKEDNDWDVVGGNGEMRGRVLEVLKKIRWRQPGQPREAATDIAGEPNVNQPEEFNDTVSLEAKQPTASKSSKPRESKALSSTVKRLGGDSSDTVSSESPQVKTDTVSSETAEAEPIRQADIVTTWSRLFGVPIRIGGYKASRGKNKVALGIYNHLTEIVRMREGNAFNIIVASHEVGHHIDKKLNLYSGDKRNSKLEQLKKDDPQKYNKVYAQLQALDYGYPQTMRVDEGIAEAVRQIITGTAKNSRLAPEAVAWVEEQIMADPKFGPAMKQAVEQSKQYRDQGAINRARMVFGGPPMDIDRGQRVKNAVFSGVKRGYTDLMDRLDAVRQFSKDIAAARELEPGEASVYEEATAFQGTLHAHTDRSIMEGVHSLITNELLSDPVANAPKLLKKSETTNDADMYAVARLTMVLPDSYNSGISKPDAQEVIDWVESDPDRAQRWQQYHRLFTDHHNAMIQVLVETGRITPEEGDRILGPPEIRSLYVPLFREQTTQDKGGRKLGAGSQMLEIPKGVQRRSKSGSDRPVMPLMQSTALKTMALYSVAQRQLLHNRMVGQTSRREGLGRWIDRIPPGTKVDIATVDQLLGQLVAGGFIEDYRAYAFRQAQKVREGGTLTQAAIEQLADMYEIEDTGDAVSLEEEVLNRLAQEPDINDVVMMYSPDYRRPNGKYVIKVIQDGNPQLYEVDPDLYEAFQGLAPETHTFITRGLDYYNRMFKAGAVGYNTAFLPANAIADAGTFAINSQYVKGMNRFTKPWQWAVVYAHSLVRGKPNELVALYRRHHGELYNYYGADSKNIDKTIRRLSGKTVGQRLAERKSLSGKALEAAIMVGDGIEFFADYLRTAVAVSDVGPRLAEAEGFFKQHGFEVRKGRFFNTKNNTYEEPSRDLVIKAMFSAGDVTYNYRRRGKIINGIERVAPFTNAALQSMDKTIRTYRNIASNMSSSDADKRKLGNQAFLSLMTLSSIYFIAKALQIDDDEELDDWEQAGYVTIHIPGTKQRISLRQSREHSWIANGAAAAMRYFLQDNKDALNDYIAEEIKNHFPVPGGGGPVGVLGEQAFNYSLFRGRSIVPEHMRQGSRAVSAYNQYDEYTTELSKLMGRTTGFSPMRIDHIMSGLTGGAYNRLGQTGEKIVVPMLQAMGTAEEADVKPLTVRDIPFARGIYRDSTPRRSVIEFYERLNEIEIEINDAVKAGVPPDAGLVQQKQQFEVAARIMSVLADASGPEYDSTENQVAIARDVLGKADHPNYPNPLYVDLPPEAAEGIRKIVFNDLNDLSRDLGRPSKSEKVTDEEYAEEIRVWEARREGEKAFWQRHIDSPIVKGVFKEVKLSPAFRDTLFGEGKPKYDPGSETFQEFAEETRRFGQRQKAAQEFLRLGQGAQ